MQDYEATILNLGLNEEVVETLAQASGNPRWAWDCYRRFIQAFNIYQPFVEFAGAGASVPLLGFGNVLWKGVKEAVDENGFLGIFMGGFKASAVGISAALIFSYLASLIFQPKMKE